MMHTHQAHGEAIDTRAILDAHLYIRGAMRNFSLPLPLVFVFKRIEFHTIKRLFSNHLPPCISVYISYFVCTPFPA